MINVISLIVIVITVIKTKKSSINSLTVEKSSALFVVNVIFALIVIAFGIAMLIYIPEFWEYPVVAWMFILGSLLETYIHLIYSVYTYKLAAFIKKDSICHCNSCGSAMPKGTIFCTNCGNNINFKGAESK